VAAEDVEEKTLRKKLCHGRLEGLNQFAGKFLFCLYLGAAQTCWRRGSTHLWGCRLSQSPSWNSLRKKVFLCTSHVVVWALLLVSVAPSPPPSPLLQEKCKGNFSRCRCGLFLLFLFPLPTPLFSVREDKEEQPPHGRKPPCGWAGPGAHQGLVKTWSKRDMESVMRHLVSWECCMRESASMRHLGPSALCSR